jgi:hypothetical protein
MSPALPQCFFVVQSVSLVQHYLFRPKIAISKCLIFYCFKETAVSVNIIIIIEYYYYDHCYYALVSCLTLICIIIIITIIILLLLLI